MVATLRERNPTWERQVLEQVHSVGYAVMEDVLSASFMQTTRAAMYRAQEQISRDVGQERLRRAGEMGVLRLMMTYDSHFFKFLEMPDVLTLIDNTVSDTAIMHLQNGSILPSAPRGITGSFREDCNKSP